MYVWNVYTHIGLPLDVHITKTMWVKIEKCTYLALEIQNIVVTSECKNYAGLYFSERIDIITSHRDTTA